MCTWQTVRGLLLLGAMNQVRSFRKLGVSQLLLPSSSMGPWLRGRGLEKVVRQGTGSALGLLAEYGEMRGPPQWVPPFLVTKILSS